MWEGQPRCGWPKLEASEQAETHYSMSPGSRFRPRRMQCHGRRTGATDRGPKGKWTFHGTWRLSSKQGSKATGVLCRPLEVNQDAKVIKWELRADEHGNMATWVDSDQITRLVNPETQAIEIGPYAADPRWPSTPACIKCMQSGRRGRPPWVLLSSVSIR